MREQTFTSNFSILHNTTKEVPYSLGSCVAFCALTILVEDDGLGPILVNARVESSPHVHQLGQPTIIYDSEGINAVRFTWQGNLPLNRTAESKLIIQAANYCGDDIKSVRFTGVKRR